MSTTPVTGASGFVGRHTVPTLLAGGHRVLALCRTPLIRPTRVTDAIQSAA